MIKGTIPGQRGPIGTLYGHHCINPAFAKN